MILDEQFPVGTPMEVLVRFEGGLLAADVQSQPGTVTISLNRPGQGHLLDVGNQYAAVILISGESASPTAGVLPTQQVAPVTDEGGVISSVVRTIVEEAHGQLDQLSSASNCSSFSGVNPAFSAAAAVSSIVLRKRSA